MAEAIKNPDALKQQLDEFSAQVHEDVKKFRDKPEIKKTLGEFTAKIAELKAQMSDKGSYDRVSLELDKIYEGLLEQINDLEKAAQKSALDRKNQNDYFLALEK